MPTRRAKSALTHVLLGLLPYTRQNFDLAFRPGKFFNELEHVSNMKRSTLQAATWRAQNRGLIERKGRLLRLTEKGMRHLEPFVADKLGPDANLMIIFDIPESMARVRRRLRLLLRDLHFRQVQKSVWISSYDSRKTVIVALRELHIESYVQVFECSRLYPAR